MIIKNLENKIKNTHRIFMNKTAHYLLFNFYVYISARLVQ